MFNRVLIAIDSDVLCKLCERLIDDLVGKIHLSSNAEEARDRLSSGWSLNPPYDLIIADVDLPLSHAGQLQSGLGLGLEIVEEALAKSPALKAILIATGENLGRAFSAYSRLRPRCELIQAPTDGSWGEQLAKTLEMLLPDTPIIPPRHVVTSARVETVIFEVNLSRTIPSIKVIYHPGAGEEPRTLSEGSLEINEPLKRDIVDLSKAVDTDINTSRMLRNFEIAGSMIFDLIFHVH